MIFVEIVRMKCRIYKLSSPHTDRVYVGSTVQTLNQRLANHRCNYSAGKNCGSCELLKLGEHDVEIELLEEIEIEHTDDPKRREYEQKWIDCTENTCNILRAEPARRNRKEYMKEYFQKNKERLQELACERITCECGSVIRRGDKARHRRTKKHRELMASKPRTLIKVNIKLKTVE